MLRSEFNEEYMILSLSKGQQVDKQKAEIYYQDLKDFDAIELKEAFRVCRIKCTFFPSIGEIISELSPLDAMRSWNRVFKVAQNGCTKWDTLSDIEVATVSAIGGMRDIQNADEKSLHFITQKYLNTYPAMKMRALRYENQKQKLSDLNVDPESYRFLKPAESGPALPAGNGPKHIKEAMKALVA